MLYFIIPVIIAGYEDDSSSRIILDGRDFSPIRIGR